MMIDSLLGALVGTAVATAVEVDALEALVTSLSTAGLGLVVSRRSAPSVVIEVRTTSLRYRASHRSRFQTLAIGEIEGLAWSRSEGVGIRLDSDRVIEVPVGHLAEEDRDAARRAVLELVERAERPLGEAVIPLREAARPASRRPRRP